MPLYDYRCPDCGDFDALRSLAQRDADAHCPHCGKASPRVLVHTPYLACMTAERRHAMETNERSAHAPQSSKDYRGAARHPPGCGCCSGAKQSTTVRSPSGAKAFPSKRPWMISH